MMKSKIYDMLRWLFYGTLITCGLGLVLAVMGLLLKLDALYFCGLILASPLYIIALPLWLLLSILFVIALFVVGICFGFRSPHRNSMANKKK